MSYKREITSENCQKTGIFQVAKRAKTLKTIGEISHLQHYSDRKHLKFFIHCHIQFHFRCLTSLQYSRKHPCLTNTIYTQTWRTVRQANTHTQLSPSRPKCVLNNTSLPSSLIGTPPLYWYITRYHDCNKDKYKKEIWCPPTDFCEILMRQVNNV